MTSITLKSHAKVNLTLHLIGPRDDGFTELDSIVAKLEAHDLLTATLNDPVTLLIGSATPRKAAAVERSPLVLTQGLSFSCNDTSLEQLGEDNLVIKGVRAVQQAFLACSPFQKERAGVRMSQVVSFPPLHLHLDKRLPYQAGLGSGSSNAAVAMQAANQLYAHYFESDPLDNETLMELGAAIGSDVPLFLCKAPLLHMTGRGEIVTPLEEENPFIHKQVILLKSEVIHVSTKEAYNAVHQARAYSKPCTQGFTAHSLHNDFESVIFNKHSELLVTKKSLLDSGAEAVMLCGSGSALMAIYKSTTTVDIQTIKLPLAKMTILKTTFIKP